MVLHTTMPTIAAETVVRLMISAHDARPDGVGNGGAGEHRRW
jgi:hypothetical protein